MIYVLGIVAVVIFMTIVQSRQLKTRRTRYFKESFGKQRTVQEISQERWDDISRWYRLQEAKLDPEEKIDDVTWNDLEMDHIFEMANHNVSFVGEQYLYRMLRQIKKDKKGLDKQEELVRYFDQHDEARLKTQMGLVELRKEEINYLIPELVDTIEWQRIPFARYSPCLLVLLVGLIVAAVVTGNTYVMIAMGGGFLLNLAVYSICKSKYEVYLQSVFAVVRTIKAAKSIYGCMEEQNQEIEQAVNKLKKLTKMTGILEGKKQAAFSGDALALFQDYVLGAFMIDFIVYDKVISEISEKKKEFMQLYSFVGETDTCISIASFRRSIDDYCIPIESDGELEIIGLRHPMIRNAVRNDYIYHKNVLITGSNASGKSTFMKSIAINLILAQSIHTCTAERVVIPDLGVMTAMAVRDDVMAEESYFIKEIKYLKRMIDQTEGKRRFFFGVDEILRGTNTKERIAASYAILQYMNKKNCILMVTTHDTELAKLLDDEYENYHFCETIREKKIEFDFKLQKGITETSNAIALLDMVGFPNEIYEESLRLSDTLFTEK